MLSSTSSLPLSNKVALVTGGCKNLGALIAHQLAPLGCHLALHYNSDSTKAAADALLKELTETYKDIKVKIFQAELTTANAVTNLFNEVAREFGGLDIMINTVGKVLKKPIIEISEPEYDEMFAVNSKAAFFCIKEASKHVRENGRIVTIVTSLLAAYTGLYSSYAGSKSPVEHFTRAASKELADKKISVVAVGPGPMDTPFFYPQESDDAVAYHKSNAMGNRLTEVTDIAPIIRFLCTEGAWITGQTIFANGGYTTR